MQPVVTENRVSEDRADGPDDEDETPQTSSLRKRGSRCGEAKPVADFEPDRRS